MDFLNHLSVDLCDNEVTGGFEWLNGAKTGGVSIVYMPSTTFSATSLR